MHIDLSLVLLRLGYGGLLVWFHGWGRFWRAYNYVVRGEPWTFVTLVEGMGFPMPGAFAAMSALSESFGALLLIAGLFSRSAAAVLVANFLVATVSEAAKGDPWELPAFYLLGAVVLLIAGPGRFSIDGARGGRSRSNWGDRRR